MESGKNIQLKLKISVSRRERSREGKGTAPPRRIQDKRDRVTGSTRGASVLVERCRKRMLRREAPGRCPPRWGQPIGAMKWREAGLPKTFADISGSGLPRRKTPSLPHSSVRETTFPLLFFLLFVLWVM